MQMFGDLAGAPFLDKAEAVNRIDLFVRQHRVGL
jgi:hypothetical protein